MRPRRRLRHFLVPALRGTVVALALLGFLAASIGFPAPAPPPERETSSGDHPFACRGRACGCTPGDSGHCCCSPEGKTDYIQADLRDTDTILKGAARTLDLTRPVAILLIAVLHFIPDADDPYAVVARLMDAVPSGSYLVIAHAAADIAPEASAEMARRYNQMASATVTPRTRDQVARFFTGLDLLPPGLVPINQWALTGHIDATTGALVGYSAIARKP